MTRPVMHVISEGGGLQSVTLYLMAAHGLITPKPEAAIFADQAADPDGTFETIRWLASGNVSDIPVYTVSRGNQIEAVLNAASGRAKRVANPPFFTLTNGQKGQLTRSCTQDYKIDAIRAKARALYEEKYGRISPGCIEMWIGITSDEATRFSENTPKYITNRYPFLEKATRPRGGTGFWMSRRDCEKWMVAHDYPIPSPGGCIDCPYRSNARWRHLRDNEPHNFARAVEIDNAIRTGLPGTKADAMFIHPDCVPLSEADIEAPDMSGDMFFNDCSGMCGV